MRITSLDLYSKNIRFASFGVRSPDFANSYIVKTIVGLDSDDIIPQFYSFERSSNKNKLYTLKPQPREIVIRISLNPQFGQNDTYSSLRDDLYKAISANRNGEVQLRLNNNLKTVAAVSGFITKYEALHFSANPEVQLTIKCESGLLKALNPIEVDTSVLSKWFPIIMDNLSTAPHGLKISLTFTGTCSYLYIGDVSFREWSFTLTPGVIQGLSGFRSQDQLHICSEAENKYVYMIRSGDTIPLMDKINPGSIWPIVFPNANDYFVDTSTGLGQFQWDSVSFYPTYWGV